MIKRKSILCIIAIVALVSGLGLSGCKKNSNRGEPNKERATKITRKMNEAYKQVGMPAITNFQELRQAKRIMEARDKEDLVCHAYLYNKYKGNLRYIGKCLGYGIPYGTQLSNPKKVVDLDDQLDGHLKYKPGKLPQPEPNGLYMPRSVDATWLMMIDEQSGEARPVYFEPTIIVSPFKLK